MMLDDIGPDWQETDWERSGMTVTDLAPEPPRVHLWKPTVCDDPWSTGRVDLSKIPF